MPLQYIDKKPLACVAATIVAAEYCFGILSMFCPVLPNEMI
jgi:hypothetical protein